MSYGLLLDSKTGRTFLAGANADSGPSTHGYLTPEDLAALVASFGQLTPTDLLLDLGCGFGEVALEVHRRTGARIVGIDASRRAIAEARHAATRASLEQAVQFEVGDLVRPPAIGARGAYAIDSLMFVANPGGALATIAATIDPGGLVFATFLRSLGMLFMPLAGSVSPAGVGLLVAHQLVTDPAATYYDIHATSLRQAIAEDHVRGRVSATFRVAGFGAVLAGTGLVLTSPILGALVITGRFMARVIAETPEKAMKSAHARGADGGCAQTALSYRRLV